MADGPFELIVGSDPLGAAHGPAGVEAVRGLLATLRLRLRYPDGVFHGVCAADGCDFLPVLRASLSAAPMTGGSECGGAGGAGGRELVLEGCERAPVGLLQEAALPDCPLWVRHAHPRHADCVAAHTVGQYTLRSQTV